MYTDIIVKTKVNALFTRRVLSLQEHLLERERERECICVHIDLPVITPGEDDTVSVEGIVERKPRQFAGINDEG